MRTNTARSWALQQPILKATKVQSSAVNTNLDEQQAEGASAPSAEVPVALKRSPAAGPCYWCDRPYRARRTGGHAQRFCRPRCRRAFHAAARRWALEAIAAGVLTLAEVKKGFAATCALS